MAEAVQQFFHVKDGRLENINASARTDLADRIHLIATGSKTSPCYLIVDRGEGQTPASFETTFLSLTRRNKDDIPFVQGRFNCGGTGVLPFCGQQNYQLIVSRRNPGCPVDKHDSTKNLWGFTLVRKLRPSAGSQRKSSMYVYLAPNREILTFSAPVGIPVLAGQSSKGKAAPAYSVNLEYGSCIKLYNYRWRKKSMLTTDGRYELERYLHSVCLPFRLSETRAYTANYLNTTLSGIMATTNDEGKEEGDANSKFEKDLGPAYGELTLPNIGKLPYRVYLLKEEHARYAREFPHGVFFTLNGQVHGDLPANFVSNVLKFDALSNFLMVSVDCTEMNQSIREDFMMASRDRVRRNEVYDEIYGELRDELRDHPGLRLHNAMRKQKRLEATLAEEKTVDYFQELLKSDPTLANILGTGTEVVSRVGPPEPPQPFVGRRFPTYFRIAKEPKGGLNKRCPLNRYVRIEFETDADNGYFERADCPGTVIFDPPNLCVSSRLWNGRFTTKFQMPFDASVNDEISITAVVSDVEREATANPFTSRFVLTGAPEQEDEVHPPGPKPGPKPAPPKPNTLTKNVAPSLTMPKIKEVRRSEWNDPFYQFDEYSAVKISNNATTNGYDFFVNTDNKYLINELHRAKPDEKTLVKHWFVYGLVLAGLGVLGELHRRIDESDEDELTLKDNDELQTASVFCAGIAKVIVPMIRSLNKLPVVAETAEAALQAAS
jgi:hypothetical protein